MTIVTQDWLCGRCGTRTPSDRCPVCDAVLAGEVRPAVRYGMAPIVPVLAATMIMALVGVVWWSSRETPSAPAQVPPSPVAQAAQVTEAPPETSASPTSVAEDRTAKYQAMAVDAFLSHSQAARQDLPGAIGVVQRCASSGLTTIKEVTEARRGQRSDVEALEVDLIAGGAELKRTLTEALQASYDADREYLKAGRSFLNRGCTGSMNLAAAEPHSQAATEAKRRFVALWNPLAEQHGLVTRGPDDI
ncbi:hypothetical protein [Herbidospora sp. RD11066]